MGLAIVTGGSSGLGAALCDAYVQRGWAVVEFSRSAPHAFSIPTDLSDPLAAARVIEDALRPLSLGDPAEVVAFNNAAVLGPVGPVEQSSPEAISAHLDTNVLSGVLFARAVVSAFGNHRCQRTFVNISSGAAVREHAGWSLYGASKAAMNSFVRAMALEQATREHPVRAFSVDPGVMDTAMQAAVRASSRDDFPDVDRYVALARNGELPSPSIVAGRIADLVEARPEPGSFVSVR